MSPPECQEGVRTGGLAWSDWSTWSREETVVTGGQLERVRRRYRVGRDLSHQACVSVMLDTEPDTGGCHLDQLHTSLPTCR